jgi:hypothetical protein
MGKLRFRRTATIWATAAVLLTAGYGIAYMRFVTPMTIVDESHHGRVLLGKVEPTYFESDSLAERWPGQILRIVFLPAHWADRRARPSAWEIPSEPMSLEVLNWRELTRRQNGAGRRNAD